MPIASLITAMFLLTPPGTPAGGFHWQRIITPPASAATEQACVALDAATFANAAPALRDLRLFQDGTELPYVIEESYDERALNSGVTADDDRSEYEVVLVMPLQLRRQGASFDGRTSASPLNPPTVFTGHAEGEVLARVPVERLRFDPAPDAVQQVQVIARPIPSSGAANVGAGIAGLQERLELVPRPPFQAVAMTLGANLQQRALVSVDVSGLQSKVGIPPMRAILEMRKRSLCYQPRSASPLVLYLGGGQGIAAKTYGLADGFSVSANRPYAIMGPLEPNPDLDLPARHAVSRLLIAIAALGCTLLLTLWIGLEFLRKEKSRPKAASS